MPSGAFHVVVEVWTVSSRRQVLVTLRDPQKELYPNHWENTGGSALSGESSRQAAVRELQEETGIEAKEEELCFLGTCQEASAFVDVYLLRRDVPRSQLRLQEGETVDAKWIDLQTLQQWIADGRLAPSTGKRWLAVRRAFEQAMGLRP